MERRGGCCIAMYGGGGDADDAWKVGRIMLRFRPIAPKPASAGSPAIAAAAPPAEAPPGARRPKRKGSAHPASSTRGRKPRKVEAKSPPSKDDGKSSPSSSSSTTTTSSSAIVTLPLMPETPERKDEPAGVPKQSASSAVPAPTAAVAPCVVPAWMGRGGAEAAAAGVGVVVAPRPVRAAGSWVSVECVTDAWREGEVAWRSDAAVRAALVADECPGFVSDELGRVTWANEAYRRMVMGAGASASSEVVGGGAVGGVEEEEEVRVELVTRGLVPETGTCRAFTCRVSVRYARRPGRTKGPSSLAVPCDVWRLDGGGCAWRLDVKAALSLSL